MRWLLSFPFLPIPFSSPCDGSRYLPDGSKRLPHFRFQTVFHLLLMEFGMYVANPMKHLTLNRLMRASKKRPVDLVSDPNIQQNDPSSVRCYLTVGHIPGIRHGFGIPETEFILLLLFSCVSGEWFVFFYGGILNRVKSKMMVECARLVCVIRLSSYVPIL